jgi:hypothetical protein
MRTASTSPKKTEGKGTERKVESASLRWVAEKIFRIDAR